MKTAVFVLVVALAFTGMASTAAADPVEDAIDLVLDPVREGPNYKCWDNPVPNEPDICIIRG